MSDSPQNFTPQEIPAKSSVYNGNGRESDYERWCGNILEDLSEGKMTMVEFAAYNVIVTLADSTTGVWMGNGTVLAKNCHCSRSYASKILSSLERKKYISRSDEPRNFLGVYPIKVLTR